MCVIDLILFDLVCQTDVAVRVNCLGIDRFCFCCGLAASCQSTGVELSLCFSLLSGDFTPQLLGWRGIVITLAIHLSV
jgi:hypothetical protein